MDAELATAPPAAAAELSAKPGACTPGTIVAEDELSCGALAGASEVALSLGAVCVCPSIEASSHLQKIPELSTFVFFDARNMRAHGDRFTFVVDEGSESEFHLDVDLRAGHRQRTPLGPQTVEVPLAQVVLELERVYVEEKLPEWRHESFLAVAAALTEDDDGEVAWDSLEGMPHEAALGESCGPEDLLGLSSLPRMQVQKLIQDFSARLEDQHTVLYSPTDRVRMPWLLRKDGVEHDILARYSLLMRDARKGTAIIELMNEFWREGLVLAGERKAEIRMAEAECEKVSPKNI